MGKDKLGKLLELPLPWPPSANAYWRHNRGRSHLSHKARRYREEVAYCVGLESPLFVNGERIAVHVEARMPDRRKRDLDNLLKQPMDALQACGVWADDGQIDQLSIRRVPASPEWPEGELVVRIGPLTGDE